MKSQYLNAIFLMFMLQVSIFPSSVCQKFDNVWLFGYNYNSSTLDAEAFNLSFDTFPPRIEIAEREVYILNGNASICDSMGNITLYSNLCKIFNSSAIPIFGGDTIMSGWELDWCEKYRWHPYDYYGIFIPRINVPHNFYFFYKSSYKSETPPLDIYAEKFKYAIIDAHANNDTGRVIVKDRILINDQLGYGQITAVKHGNGRDWWLPMPVEIGNKIHIVLLTKDTAYLHHSQHIGPAWDENGGFQASFSPDGSKYVRYNRFHGVFIYDFDRCDGTLSNVAHFPFNDTTQGIFGGCAVSPNNRYLYVADFEYLYQFDLQADDIFSSKQLIAVYDGYTNNLATLFSYIINAPDGRMYVVPPTTTKNMHVINRPNLPGVACDFRQHDIEFPYPYGNTPVFPNFRLGPLDGSPCDTLGLDNHPLADFRPEPTDTSGLAMHFWDVSAYEPAQWLWDFGDGAMSQDTSPVHAYASPGFYTVCLTVSNQYGADTKCKVVEVKKTSGTLTLPKGEGAFLLWPNPTTGEVRWGGLPEGEEVTMRVHDALGRLCLQATTRAGRADLGGLAAGLYYWHIVAEKGAVYSGKVEKR